LRYSVLLRGEDENCGDNEGFHAGSLLHEILRRMKLLLLFPFAALAVAQSWVLQTSGTTASLRGVSAVSASIAWASGSGATWLRTVDGGANWKADVVPGAEDSGQPLDFRGIRALDANTAYLMSSGPGTKSRIYKTVDGGVNWKLLFTNPDEKGFFDAIAFWDARNGIVAGDPVDGSAAIFITGDGGEHWRRSRTPPALKDEGAFAASNSCLTVRGNNQAWFGTGGPGAGRVLRTKDGGRSWSVAVTPIRKDVASAGIFSLAFSDSRHGIAVGGNYSKDRETRGNVAFTGDGGAAWTGPVAGGPNGFRSAVIRLAKSRSWLATGTSGSDISADGGKTWHEFDDGAFHALGQAGGSVWAVGPKGRIGRLRE
jgi:photosystem II stability/assembly factor-like uncharacterized protein